MSNHYIIPIFVPHRGCPHDCVFCNQKKITGSEKEITAFDVASTIDEYMETIRRTDDTIIELSFFGGSFTGIPMEYQNELLEAAKKAKELKLIDAIRLSTRPDYIDTKILNNLKKYDVGIIELGVQSMDFEVLNAAERGHSAEDVIKASNLIKQYNFRLGLQMMIGLPQDNEIKDLYTADEIIKLKPDFVRIYPSLIIRDTELEELYYGGQYEAMSLREAVNISKKLYYKFTNSGIQIIRLGLQTTDQISLNGAVIGGPYHPAFRELVESSILNDMVDYAINNYYINIGEIFIKIHPKDISKLFADKKSFFNEVINKYKSKKIIVRQDKGVDRMSLSFSSVENDKIMSLYEFIKLEK